MPHQLDDPIEKVIRARHHAQELKPLLRAFREAYAGSFGGEVDEQTGNKSWVMLIDPPAPGLNISMVLGEAVYQYRSALDHLAWQLVLTNNNIPGDRTAFPVCNVNDWGKWATRSRIEGMHPDAQTFLKDQQPGNGFHPNREQWLLWLDDLWNVDKHRHIFLGVSGSGGGMFSHPLPVGSANEVFVHDGPIGRGTVLAAVPAEHADVEFGFRPSVTFGQSVACEGEHIEMVLAYFDVLVTGTIDGCRQFFPTPGPAIPPDRY